MIESIVNFLVWIVKRYSWTGVLISMVMESACLPVPSEVVMPLAGFALCENLNCILYASIIASIANLIGSWIAYTVGYYGGRTIIVKYGKYLLITKEDYLRAENFFSKYGGLAILIGRMLPIARTVISLPAGVFSMNPLKFTIYTMVGSIPWNFTLTYLGYYLSENWHLIVDYLKYLDYLLVVLLVIFIAIFIMKRMGKLSYRKLRLQTSSK